MYQLNLPDEPATKVAKNIGEKLLPEWWAKFIKKNTAYGDKLATGGDLGIKAFIPEMNRKMQGIINMVWHEQPQGEGEGAREKAMDLIGHLFIFVHNLDQDPPQDEYGKARSALGWPRPDLLSYGELQRRGEEILAKPRCPQDSSHPLDSHAPGGAWYGHGHDGLPSPWPGGTRKLRTNPLPQVAVNPRTGDLQPHPLMRGGPWLRDTEPGPMVVMAAPPIHPAVRAVNDEELPRDPNNYQGTYYEEPPNLVRPGGFDWREWETED